MYILRDRIEYARVMRVRVTGIVYSPSPDGAVPCSLRVGYSCIGQYLGYRGCAEEVARSQVRDRSVRLVAGPRGGRARAGRSLFNDDRSLPPGAGYST